MITGPGRPAAPTGQPRARVRTIPAPPASLQLLPQAPPASLQLLRPASRPSHHAGPASGCARTRYRRRNRPAPGSARPAPAQHPNPRHFPGDSDPLGLGPPDWAAQAPYPNHSGGQAAHERSLDYGADGWVGHDPYRRQPPVPRPPPYPGHTSPFWRQGWADYDPYTGYPGWPGHPASAARNAGLRRLSKLTWRAAEVSAIVAVGFVALFARTAHSATRHVQRAAPASSRPATLPRPTPHLARPIPHLNSTSQSTTTITTPAPPLWHHRPRHQRRRRPRRRPRRRRPRQPPPQAVQVEADT